MLKGFWPGRTACHIDVDGNDLIDSLDNTINVIHPSAVGTGAHRDDPFGFRHLFV